MAKTKLVTILFVGSNPSNASETEVAFHEHTKSSKILTEWISHITGMKMMINVQNEKTEGNRPLRKSEIKANLPRLKEDLDLIKPTKIVALGKTATEALKAVGAEFYEMPHPSGLNRQLNDKEFVEGKIKGLIEYCSTSPIDS